MEKEDRKRRIRRMTGRGLEGERLRAVACGPTNSCVIGGVGRDRGQRRNRSEEQGQRVRERE